MRFQQSEACNLLFGIIRLTLSLQIEADRATVYHPA